MKIQKSWSGAWSVHVERGLAGKVVENIDMASFGFLLFLTGEHDQVISFSTTTVAASDVTCYAM